MEAEGIGLALFRLIYRRVRPGQLETHRPKLKWFPKYKVGVKLSEKITQSEEPDRELEKLMHTLGFELESWTKEHINFSRGKSWGDFSVRLLKLRIAFTTPLIGNDVTMAVEVADVCLFDTGDLWALTGEVLELVQKQSDDS